MQWFVQRLKNQKRQFIDMEKKKDSLVSKERLIKAFSAARVLIKEGHINYICHALDFVGCLGWDREAAIECAAMVRNSLSGSLDFEDYARKRGWKGDWLLIEERIQWIDDAIEAIKNWENYP